MRILSAHLCTLEPLVAAHAREMFAVLSDPAIYEFENEPPASVESLTRRFEKIEGRWSPDGKDQWLNRVVRLSSGHLAGYVQATVVPGGLSYVAYELNSQYWRQGIGKSAVLAMLAELNSKYAVGKFVAILKAANFRSNALLRSLDFTLATPSEIQDYRGEPDEIVMVLSAAAKNAA